MKDRLDTIKGLVVKYRVWLHRQDDDVVKNENDYAVWAVINLDKNYGRISKTIKKETLKAHKKAIKGEADIDFRFYDKFLPKKRSKVRKVRKSKSSNRKPLLVKKAHGNKVRSRKSRRSLLSMPHTSLGKRKNGRLHGLHDKKVRTKRLQRSKVKGKGRN